MKAINYIFCQLQRVLHLILVSYCSLMILSIRMSMKIRF